MNDKLKRIIANASKVFILTDENVAPFWLPETEYWLGCEEAVEIVLKPGERQKHDLCPAYLENFDALSC